MKFQARRGHSVLLLTFCFAVLFTLGATLPKNLLQSPPEIDIVGGTLDSETVSPKTASVADWTWMVYLDADCNLEAAGISDLNEMEVVGSTSRVNIIVQIDRIPGYDSSNGAWTGCRRYKVVRDSSVYTIGSTLMQDLGEVNMGNPTTLSDFIDWGKTNYPANHYALILWDHGSGSMFGSSIGGACWDDTNGEDYLTLTEIRNVLSTRPVDVLAYDACLMGGIETYYENRNTVTVGVGSEETEPGAGYPYDTILQWLTINPSATAEQLGQTITTKYMDYYNTYTSDDVTQGSARSSSLVALTTAVDILARDLIICPTNYATQVKTARANSQAFASPEFIDLYDFCAKLKLQITTNATITADANAVQAAITAALVAEGHTSGYPGAHGISIYFATTSSEYSPDYETLQFAINSRWDNLIRWAYGIQGGESGSDDVFEENDAFGSASAITPGYWQNLICKPGDNDTYSIQLQAGSYILVDIYFVDTAGDLDLYFYNSAQSRLNQSISTDDNESISYTVSTTGTYYIQVYFYGTGTYNGYSMWIFAPYIDDSYEQNDVPSMATDVTSLVNSGPILNLVGNDLDHYNFTVSAGNYLSVTLQHVSNDGDCDIYLYSPTGSLIASSSTAGIENIYIGIDYAGEYMLKVSPKTIPIGHVIPFTSSYTLTISTQSVVSLDDAWEDNDWFDEAWTVGFGQVNNLVALDYDFFNITFTGGTWVNVTILFSHSQGDLDLYLYDPDGVCISWSGSYTDNEMVHAYIEKDGEYTILVDNYEDNLHYTLIVSLSTADDIYEDNEYFDSAAPITYGITYTDLVCWDWDCYNITIPASTTYIVQILFSDAAGDLDLYVFDEFSEYFGGSAQSGVDTELVTFSSGVTSQTFTILVYNYENNPSYTLRTFLNTIPSALFEASQSSGVNPLTVSFTDHSTSTGYEGITSWLWTFDDGNVSTVQNPTNTFTYIGEFHVTLTVTDLSGDESSSTLTIVVERARDAPPPPFDFGTLLVYILVPFAGVLIVVGIIKNRQGGRGRIRV